jgi:HK97 gp10 family phage protein
MREFSLLEFAGFMSAMAAEIPMAHKRALEKAAEIIETEAKAEIGHYQGAAGPFAAWPELDDKTKADRVRQGFTENDPLLRTGEMRDSIGTVIEGDEAHVGSNDDKAVWQELGTEHIPPRSFLGHAAVTKSKEVSEIIGREIFGLLTGESMLDGATGEHAGEIEF